MPKRELNGIDRKILTALQENARISNVDLAETVGLSPSPCLRRVKMLEKQGSSLVDDKGRDICLFSNVSGDVGYHLLKCETTP